MLLAVAPPSSCCCCCCLRIVEAAEAAVVELSSLDDVAVMMNYCFFDSILLSQQGKENARDTSLADHVC